MSNAGSVLKSLSLELLNEILPVEVNGFSETPMDHFGRQGNITYLDLELPADISFPRRLVVKRIAAGEVAGLSHDLDCFEREVEAYKRGSAFFGVPMLNCYHAEYDAESRDMLVILQDVSHLFGTHYRQYPFNMTPVDAAHRAAAYAHLHARHWMSNELESEHWLLDMRTADNRAYERVIPDVPAVVNKCVDVLEVVMTDYWADCFEKLLNYPQFKDRLTATTWTLIHGDANGGNSVFDGDDLILMDWNFAAIGNPGLDLAYILNNETADAITAIDTTIESYQETMANLGINLSHDEIVTFVRMGALAQQLGELERLSHMEKIPPEKAEAGIQDMLKREQNFRHLQVERLWN